MNGSLPRKMWTLVLPGHRRAFVLIVLAAMVGGIVELAGVTTIFPFLSLMNRPELAQRQPLLHWLFVAGGFNDVRRFIFDLGLLAIAVFTFANFYLFLKNALVIRFAYRHMSHLSLRLMRHYFAKPYPFFVENHSAQIAKDILVQSDIVANSVLFSWMTMIAESFTLATLTGLVLYVNVKVGVTIIVCLGGVVFAAYFLTRKKVVSLGQRSDEANSRRFAYCLEALSAIKEIKATETEIFFCHSFLPHAEALSDAYIKVNVVNTFPTFLVQALTASFIIALGLYHVRAGKDLAAIVPILSLYVVAGYRLLPSLLKFSGAAAQLKQNQHVFDHVCSVLADPDSRPVEARPASPLAFAKEIQFQGVAFKYPSAAKPVFQDFDFAIAKNEFLAVVGGSGAGKSTLVDLLLGLLKPDAGRIAIDGAALSGEALRAWRAAVAYIPQTVFLLDGTIAENVAFGVPEGSVDLARVKEAARHANLADFIETLPDGYQARVGERGAKLSGGQRQRLGIARALYRDPQVLIMDESTSALDGVTEKSIVDTVLRMKGLRTVVVIAHRHSTVRAADRIVVLEGGKIVDAGGYDELIRRTPRFGQLMSDPAVTA